MRRTILALFIFLIPLGAQASPLEQKIRALVRSESGRMRVGVSVRHLRAGEAPIEIDGDRAYPLASVFKLPIMIELARQLQEGRAGLSLQTPLTLHEADKVIGSGTLQHAANGTRVSLARCVELMETISDNTATDLVFNRIGTASVNSMLSALRLSHSSVWLTNRAAYLIALGMGSEWRGLKARAIARRWEQMSLAQQHGAVERILAENRGLTLAAFQRVEDASAAQQTGQAYLDDVYLAGSVDNVASPGDVADLLARLYQGKLLDARWTRYCLGVLARQKYNSRIPRDLPRGTRTWHKTGTIAGIHNDAGVVEVGPGNAFAVAVFIRDIREGCGGRADRLIGRIARAAYDAYR